MRLSFAAALILFAGLSTVAKADSVTVGPPTLTGGANTDSCTACGMVIDQAFGTPGLTLTSYSIDANAAGTITPVLFTRSGDVFTVVGIGAANTASVGINNFAFTLSSGTAITTANSYFGFVGGGVIGFNITGSGEDFVLPDLSSSGLPLTINETFTEMIPDPTVVNAYDEQVNRAYQVNAVASTPEPSSIAPTRSTLLPPRQNLPASRSSAPAFSV